MEVNQIRNDSLKESLANTAINILLHSNLVTESDLSGLKVDIGYLFAKEDGEYESLFKLMLPAETFFFALQEV